jgi:hypothetical protein
MDKFADNIFIFYIIESFNGQVNCLECDAPDLPTKVKREVGALMMIFG